jgi:hypothetical protein
MADKIQIHCDLLALYGPNWAELPPDKPTCIAENVHSFPQLLGTEPELYGFVGTRRIMDNIVGGYFAIQYTNEEFLYNRNKELNIENHAPFARLFFVLFAKSGKVLLQNSKFAGIPLNMSRALGLFKKAIDQVLSICGVSKTFNIDLVPEEITDADFIKEFEQSTRVIGLEVSYPNGDNIPEGFKYYNPQVERNSIIRESHKHDYSGLKKVDLEAAEDGDLRKLHLRDLIYAGRSQFMRYYKELNEFTLRRVSARKFEFQVDMEAEQIPIENVLSAIEKLRRERAVILDTPTPIPSPETDEKETQMNLFKDDEDNNEE